MCRSVGLHVHAISRVESRRQLSELVLSSGAQTQTVLPTLPDTNCTASIFTHWVISPAQIPEVWKARGDRKVHQKSDSSREDYMCTPYLRCRLFLLCNLENTGKGTIQSQSKGKIHQQHSLSSSKPVLWCLKLLPAKERKGAHMPGGAPLQKRRSSVLGYLWLCSLMVFAWMSHFVWLRFCYSLTMISHLPGHRVTFLSLLRFLAWLLWYLKCCLCFSW